MSLDALEAGCNEWHNQVERDAAVIQELSPTDNSDTKQLENGHLVFFHPLNNAISWAIFVHQGQFDQRALVVNVAAVCGRVSVVGVHLTPQVYS